MIHNAYRQRDPLWLIPWAGALWTLGPEYLALGYTDGAALASGVPDEVGTADFTRSAAGPVHRAAGSASCNGYPAFETTATEILASAASSVSLSTTYSVFLCGRQTSLATATIVGGHTSASNIQPILNVFNLWGHQYGGTARTGGTVDTTYHRILAVCTASNDTLYVDGTAIVSGSDAGSGTPTRLAVGGFADKGGAECAVQACFLGWYQGDLTAHENYAQLLAVM